MNDISSIERDTIAAIATAPGRGAVGIIRLSGPRARSIAEQLCGIRLQPRHAHYCNFNDARDQSLDSGLALLFPAPHSFTGEDVAELQAHGGPIVMDMLLRACCSLGARQARPGEFSERAFLNDKIDLAQAEAIADLINCETEQAVRNANRSLQGVFSLRIEELVGALVRLRVYVEAAIDFPEEEIDFLADGRVAEQLDALTAQLHAVQAEARQGSLIREGMKVVIAGRPNAGKSSLLNALSGQDSAIVTSVEGTTRDVLREHIQIDGMPLHVVDTAGLRESPDEVEREGIRRARLEMASADRILLVVDGSRTDTVAPDRIIAGLGIELPRDVAVTVVRNKCDLTCTPPGVEPHGDWTLLNLSATTGEGMQELREHLKTCMGYQAGIEGGFSARRRHLQALDLADSYLAAGRQQLLNQGAGELLAEDLRQCQKALEEITGTFSADDLLGEIFSSFCIGK
jgi:tRNA modification GTPase